MNYNTSYCAALLIAEPFVVLRPEQGSSYAFVTTDALPDADAILYVQNIAAYPISQGRILNVAASITNRELEGTIYEGPWTTEVSQEEVRKEYVGWEPEVEEIVQVCLMSSFRLVLLT